MNAKQLLSLVFEQEEFKSIPFMSTWANGTGYFDNAVKGKNAPVIEAGTIVKSVDNFGRKIIIIGTRVGNVVIFERYTDPASTIVVSNEPKAINAILGSLVTADNGSLSTDGIAKYAGLMYGNEKVFSYSDGNIGQLIEKLFK